MKNFPGKRMVAEVLTVAFAAANELFGGEEVVQRGAAFGDMENDTEIKADKEIGEALLKYLSNPLFGIRHISIEGMPDYEVDGAAGSVWACVDPLDGSLNYQMKGDTIGLPYSTCITILSKKEGARFSDIIAAGVVDLRTGDAWAAWIDGKGKKHSTINGNPAKPEKRELDLGSMIVIGEMYYFENRGKLVRIFQGTKGWLRNPGSAAYEMALVASGNVGAYICDRQKQHELGAAYVLVTWAGGMATDFKGKDLGEREFHFNAQTPVILAGNQKILANILYRMKNATEGEA